MRTSWGKHVLARPVGFICLRLLVHQTLYDHPSDPVWMACGAAKTDGVVTRTSFGLRDWKRDLHVRAHGGANENNSQWRADREEGGPAPCSELSDFNELEGGDCLRHVANRNW